MFDNGTGRFHPPAKVANFGVDYTPRQRGIDVDSLRDALQDALRQTPTLYFVGETREPADWRSLLAFAGSGHLVVTTSHAGGLVETLSRILRAVDAKTPELRGEVANRLVAAVHLKSTVLDDGVKATVPAVWRRTPVGVKALVSEGLSSILPQNPLRWDSQKSSLGRFYFAKQLVDQFKTGPHRKVRGSKSSWSTAQVRSHGNRLLDSAREWDLEGV